MTFTDVTNNKLVYAGSLCSLTRSVSGQDAGSNDEQGFLTPPAHHNVGGQLPSSLGAGTSILYEIVVQPKDAEQGLPTAAQYTKTSVNLVFTGFDH